MKLAVPSASHSMFACWPLRALAGLLESGLRRMAGLPQTPSGGSGATLNRRIGSFTAKSLYSA